MRSRLIRWLSLILAITIVCQLLIGCSGKNDSASVAGKTAYERVIPEEYIFENQLGEEKFQEAYIIENLLYEEGIYEYKVSEDIISDAYIIEVAIGEQAKEQIRSQLPNELAEYDIDWPKIIGKFAVGTTIIIVVGIVNYASKGSMYFVFGSSATVAKDALVGGAISATLKMLNGYSNGRKITEKGIAKYAIEGFADGYMWGAIASVKKIASENLKRLKTFKLATGGTATLRPDGRVFDEAGKLIGKAYYEKDGMWYLLDEASQALQVFDKAGRAVTDPSVLAAITSLPRNAYLRLGTASEAAICYTDDLGNVIRIGNELIPNICYQLNGYTYYTDDIGRISKVVFDELKLHKGHNRSLIAESKSVIGRGFEQLSDDRGHLIADMFGGDNTIANIVLMDSHVNRSTVKAIELSWQSCINRGEHVQGVIELAYSGESFRPDSFKYIYDIGEGLRETLISNIF